VLVKEQNGEPIHFKIKKTAKFEKVKEAFATKRGVSAQSVRFTFEGTRVEMNKTPLDYGIEDNDQIDAALEQTGGW